ncbi:DUF3558 domain-containing protein [Prauserella flavalba]|uniref:DUF3558 domain-containing protein n=1 Tax=Prauserella flavalba TaxID=1477506 RepID=UPI0036E989AE
MAADRMRVPGSFFSLVPLLLLTAACGRVEGMPAQADGVSTSPPSSTQPAALDPCGLLTPAERSTAGLTSTGEQKSLGGARACDYTEPGSYGVTITIDETSGLADLRTEEEGTAEQVRIGAHDALRVADHDADDGTCAVLLGTGESASVHVDVTNTNFTGTAQACTRADTVAGLIEPKLPGGLS